MRIAGGEPIAPAGSRPFAEVEVMKAGKRALAAVGGVLLAVALVASPTFADKKEGRYRVVTSPEFDSPAAIEGYLNEIAERGWLPINLNVEAFRRKTTGDLDGVPFYELSSGQGGLLILRRE
jgi:hypothetical protein